MTPTLEARTLDTRPSDPCRPRGRSHSEELRRSTLRRARTGRAGHPDAGSSRAVRRCRADSPKRTDTTRNTGSHRGV